MLKTKAIKPYRNLLIFLVLIYIVFGAVSLVTLNPHLDEIDSHLPTVITFFNNDLISAVKSDCYKSASTPLPYIIVSFPLKLLYITPTLLIVRVFSILISIMTIIIFLRLCDDKKNNLLYPALILLFYPYFLKPSFAFFMSIYGLIFFLLFIYLIEKKTSISILLAGICLAAAVLSQQFYLIVFLFYAGYYLYKEFITQSGTKNILSFVYFVIPFILPLSVFILWGGLTHPNYRYWGTVFSFQNLTGVMITLGSALLPYIVFNIKEIKVQILITILLLSVALVFFAFPVWVNQPIVGGISGMTFNFLAKVNNVSSILSFILKTAFCIIGLSSFVILYKKAIEDKSRLILFLYAVLAIGFSLNKLPSERHMLPLIAVGYLLVFNQSVKKFVLRYWLAYSVIIGSVYFYYIMFLYKIN